MGELDEESKVASSTMGDCFRRGRIMATGHKPRGRNTFSLYHNIFHIIINILLFLLSNLQVIKWL